MERLSTRPSRAYWLWPVILGAALYLISLPGTWIYDDLYFAHDDPRLADVHQWKNFLTQEYMDGSADKLWRPLVSLSFAVQTYVHPERAWPFHLVNLLLHAGVCGLVAALARRLAGESIGLIAGLLFAAHPIHVEAVSGIVGRAEEMCAIGVIGALLLVIGHRLTVGRVLAVTGCFLFAALSKEQGILLPFILLWGWMLLRDFVEHEPGDSQAGLLLVALLTGTLAAYISYRNSVAPWFWDKYFLDWTMNPIVRSGSVDRWLIPVAIFGRYVSLLLVPWRLSIDYGADVFTPTQSPGDPYLWIGVVALGGLAALSIGASRRRKPLLLFLLGCFAITYFLAANIVIIGTVFGERLMYLPSAFACILAGMAIAKLRAAPRAALVAAILLGYCARTETYAWRWRDRASFYAYSAEAQPKSSQIWLLLGDELERRRADFDGAERAYARGREACPAYWRIWDSSARLAMKQAHYEQAETLATHAMLLRPNVGTSQLLSDIAEKRNAAN